MCRTAVRALGVCNKLASESHALQLGVGLREEPHGPTLCEKRDALDGPTLRWRCRSRTGAEPWTSVLCLGGTREAPGGWPHVHGERSEIGCHSHQHALQEACQITQNVWAKVSFNSSRRPRTLSIAPCTAGWVIGSVKISGL